MSDFLQPMDYSPPGSLSVKFSRQEYRNGLPFPPPGDLAESGIEPTSPASPALAGRFFTTMPPGKPPNHWTAREIPKKNSIDTKKHAKR